MTTIRYVILFISFAMPASFAWSQESDFGVWYSVSAEHKLIKRLDLDLSAALRTFENAAKVEEVFFEGGLSYKLTSFLTIGGAYRISENIEDDLSYHLRHKLFGDIKGTYSPGNFDISGRARFQRRYKTFFEDEEDKIPDSHGRYRIKILYRTPSFPVNPYISYEIFCPMNKDPERAIDKTRIAGGIEYKISKNHAVEIDYTFQSDFIPKQKEEHIVSLNYDLKF